MFIQQTGGDYVNILASSGHDIKRSYSTSVSVMIARIQDGISGAGGWPARSAHVREHASHSESDCLDNESEYFFPISSELLCIFLSHF